MAGIFPDYDALIKSDPTLYEVAPDITLHCRITLDKEQKEQYRPLVDEIDHDTLIPCLELVFLKILRQWSDIRDDNISLESLYEVAVRKANADGRHNLARAKKIYDGIINSIRHEQRGLEAAVISAAECVSRYLQAEPVRKKEQLLWVGSSFVFYALDNLRRQLGQPRRPTTNGSDREGKELADQGMVLFLPLSAEAISWFTENYDRHKKVFRDTTSAGYGNFTKEIKQGGIDDLLRGIAAKNAAIRVIGDNNESRILEWRLQFLGPAAWRFSLINLEEQQPDRPKAALSGQDGVGQQIFARGGLSRQIEALITRLHGNPVYRDAGTPRVYLSELQSLFWERIRLTLIKAALAQERCKVSLTDHGPTMADEMLQTKIHLRRQSKKPFNILVLTEKDTLSFMIYLIIKEYTVNNGIDEMCRPRFFASDKTLVFDRSLINGFARFKNLLDSNEIDISPGMTDQGTEKLSVMTPEVIQEADAIIVDHDETEIAIRRILDIMIFNNDEGKPIIINLKTLMFNHRIHDFGVFLLNEFCLDLLQKTLDLTILPVLRGLYNPRSHILRYGKKRFGVEAQECAREEIKNWAENSRDPKFHR